MANTTPYDQRLDQLLTTAAAVFAERGYHPTTMRTLARETGLSLAGIYHYVPSKDELLFLIQERCFSRVIKGAHLAIDDKATPHAKLQGFIEHHTTFFAHHMNEMKVLSHEAESLAGDRRTSIRDLKRRYVNLAISLVEALATPNTSPFPDPRIATFALFGMMNWIYTWYDPDGPITPDDLAHNFGSIFLNGVVTPTPLIAHGG